MADLLRDIPYLSCILLEKDSTQNQVVCYSNHVYKPIISAVRIRMMEL